MDSYALVSGGPAVPGVDVIGANLGHAPAGVQLAGYSTGTGPVPWTQAQWDAHPGAVRIDQDAYASDPTADVLDVERGAATIADCPRWVNRALAGYAAAARPGQRSPAIYASAANITPIVNELTAGGVTSGAGLVVANWSFTQADAFAAVLNAAGPYPIVGFQFRSLQYYDEDVFSGAWLAATSGHHPGGAGPYPHFSTAGETLGGLAASRHMTVFAWLALQERLHPGDARYLAGNATARQGSRWWSLKP